MSAAVHRVGLERATREGRLPPLRGSVPDAVWDPELRASIVDSGGELEEELVIDVLLDDLRGHA